MVESSWLLGAVDWSESLSDHRLGAQDEPGGARLDRIELYAVIEDPNIVARSKKLQGGGLEILNGAVKL